MMSTYKEVVNTVVGRFTSLIFSKVSELKKETVCPWATVRMSWSLESSMLPTGLVKSVFCHRHMKLTCARWCWTKLFDSSWVTVKCKLWFFWFFKVENTEEFVIGSSGQGNRVFGKVDWFNNVLVLQVEQFFAIDGVPYFGREIRCSTSCNKNKQSESKSEQGQKLGIRNPEIRNPEIRIRNRNRISNQ